MENIYLKKGFTLIELLVVIAIIGLLSSVVLASLNTARGKAANTAIKSDLSNIRAQAELYYDSNLNSYGTFTYGNCGTSPTGVFSNANVKSAIAHALSQSSDTTNGAKCVAIGSPAAWAAEVLLKTTEGVSNSWCVDSTGQIKGTTGTTIGASDAVCG